MRLKTLISINRLFEREATDPPLCSLKYAATPLINNDS